MTLWNTIPLYLKQGRPCKMDFSRIAFSCVTIQLWWWHGRKGILTALCEETWPHNVSVLSALHHGTPHPSQSDGKCSQSTHEIPLCTSCDTAWKDQRLLSDCSSLLLLKKFPGAENILNPFFSLIVKEERFIFFLHYLNPEILWAVCEKVSGEAGWQSIYFFY